MSVVDPGTAAETPSSPTSPVRAAPAAPPRTAVPGGPPAPPIRPARPPNTRFFRSELRLVFGRRRNLGGMALLAAVPIIIAVAMRVTAHSTSAGGTSGGPDFFSAIAGNGLFVALAALTVELPLFLPIAVAAISGDSVAGEANTGTLRYLLAVPVDRTRLLAVKYAGVIVFAFAATLLVALVGVLIGLALFGGGPVTLLSGTQIGMGPALLRLLGICAYIAVGLCALGAIGLFVSTLTEQPMGAAIAVTMLTVISFVLDAIPQLDWLHPYLLTHHWQDYGELLRDPIGLAGMRGGLASAASYIVVFLSAAWARFGARDVTS
jgi:ABC-2 type transport system permease protein